jgi:hypothetical protein
MGYKGYDDDGEKDWEEWMDQCERIWREQGIGAYKACGCDTKTKRSAPGAVIVPRAPETKTLTGRSVGGYEMKSNLSTKAGGGDGGPEIITKLANKAIKAIQSHVEALHDAADDVESLVDGKKSGRAFSHDNAQALRDHAQNLHDLADDHEAVVKHLKKVVSAADDLATWLQGSEPTYAEPNTGRPLAGQQEGSGKHFRGTYETKSSSGTITENDMADALRQLQGIRALGRAPQETFVERQLKAAQRVTQAHQDRFQRELAQARQESWKTYW